MSRFIEEEVEKPKTGRVIVRWVLLALMCVCVFQIFAGLFMMNHGHQLWGIWRLIQGSFFFLILYTVHWLMRN